jgi:hypothetical protein
MKKILVVTALAAGLMMTGTAQAHGEDALLGGLVGVAIGASIAGHGHDHHRVVHHYDRRPVHRYHYAPPRHGYHHGHGSKHWHKHHKRHHGHHGRSHHRRYDD